MGSIDGKYLKGLKFKFADRKKVKVEGGPDRIEYTPKVRPLLPSDVLSWKVRGNELTLVAADGQKHVVPYTENKVKMPAAAN